MSGMFDAFNVSFLIKDDVREFLVIWWNLNLTVQICEESGFLVP